VQELQGCHVGLLPIQDTPWSSWKFYFKAVQYMALGLPVVARRMASVSEVVRDGINGFLVEGQDEWYERLRLLTEHHQLRRQMGQAARATVVTRFSLQAHMPSLASILNELVDARLCQSSQGPVETNIGT
jgi:glycosyltransferase involved in cell wall biosynthesis